MKKKDIFLLHGLTQIIKSPTSYDLHHNSSSLIDVIFTKETSRIAKSEVLSMSISDHDMIGCVCKMNNMKLMVVLFAVEIIETIIQNSYKKIFVSQI